MKLAKDQSTWFFVDESGDPTFYDREGKLIAGRNGCSPVLIMGFVELANPNPVRGRILTLQKQILSDPFLSKTPSIHKTSKAFHAKDDTPEVRYLFFKLLSTVDMRAQFVVARKVEKVFRSRFNGSETRFYDHLVETLFQDMLHRYNHNHIYFANRGSSPRTTPLARAIDRAIKHFETKWDTTITSSHTVYPQTPHGEPCLSLVDYMNWAVHRAFVRREMRYYDFISDKVSLLIDLYDRDNYPHNWYNRRNPFHIDKTSPLDFVEE
jgi:hypothetical protein